MLDSGWAAHLNEAASEGDVLTLCNQFLSLVGDGLGEIPEGCRPRGGTSLDASRVQYLAVKLLKEVDNDPDGANLTLHRVSAFFTKAAQRLAEV
jgi:hypothetical protein